MTGRLDALLGGFAAAWVDLARRRAAGVVVVAALGTALSGIWAARHLGVNGDTSAMLSERLPFKRVSKEIDAALPASDDNVVIVVDAETPALARDAADALARRLESDPRHFASVYVPGGGSFFARHGLLYLDVDDLEELVDHLAAAQPLLAELATDPRLPTFLSLLERAVRERDMLAGIDLAPALDRVARSLDAALAGRAGRLSWEEWMLGDGEKAGRRRVVLARLLLDHAAMSPAREALAAVRRAARELGFGPGAGVRVRLTGDPALEAEQMEIVQPQAKLAGLVAAALAVPLLLLALGSVRLVVMVLATLVAGLAWTAGFAALAVGHLNLISVAFAALFIGLGVDFGIHFGVRLRELRRDGLDVAEAVREGGRSVGSSLILCATTTAIGFYAFVPTGYAGVAELGLISGTGMFLSLAATLTLLPALVRIVGDGPPPRLPRRLRLSAPAFPIRYPRAVTVAAGVAALAGFVMLPRLHFDPNPLNLRDPAAESVQAMRDLFADEGAKPWTIDLLAPDLDAARRLAGRIESLPAVDKALTLADFVPAEQADKLAVLEDAALFLGPLRPIPAADPAAPDLLSTRRALAKLQATLDKEVHSRGGGDLASSARGLLEAVTRTRARLEAAPTVALLQRLQTYLLGDLPRSLRHLEQALDAAPVTLDDLPAPLRDRYLAADGRARVEVFPRDDLQKRGAAEHFVDAVRAVAPHAAGSAVLIVASARAVVAALRQAFGLALVGIVCLLVALWRSATDTFLVMAPLVLAALLTAAASVLLHLPLNFADVIVLPLLLGIGVDSGIHLVHRYRHASPHDRDLLHTSTARAVLFSALTTMASFGSLALSTDRGLASIGELLTVGLALTLVANLVVLPALLAWDRPAAPPG